MSVALTTYFGIGFGALDNVLLQIRLILLFTFLFGLKIHHILQTRQPVALRRTQTTKFSFIQFLLFMILPCIHMGLRQYKSALSSDEAKLRFSLSA